MSQSNGKPSVGLLVIIALLIIWLICTVTMVIASDTRNTSVTAAPELSIMSFNIRYGTARDGADHWRNRHDLVFDVIRDHEPDIVGLQEALRFQIDEILEACPEYVAVGVGRDDGATRGEYCAIMYRPDVVMLASCDTFWLSDTPREPGSTSWGNSITRICTQARFVHRASGEPFYVFNTHFDHQSQPARVRSAQAIVEEIAQRQFPASPVVITGDFNADENSEEITTIKRVFADTYRLAHPDATGTGTFNAFKGHKGGPKIDYVFVNPSHCEVVTAAIIHDHDDGRYPSDHFPVSARIRLTTK